MSQRGPHEPHAADDQLMELVGSILATITSDLNPGEVQGEIIHLLAQKATRASSPAAYTESLLQNVRFLFAVEQSLLDYAEELLERSPRPTPAELETEIEVLNMRHRGEAAEAVDPNVRAAYDQLRDDQARREQLEFDYAFHYVYRTLVANACECLARDATLATDLAHYDSHAVRTALATYCEAYANMLLGNVKLAPGDDDDDEQDDPDDEEEDEDLAASLGFDQDEAEFAGPDELIGTDPDEDDPGERLKH